MPCRKCLHSTPTVRAVLEQWNGFQYKFLSAVIWSTFMLSICIKLFSSASLWSLSLKTLGFVLLGWGGFLFVWCFVLGLAYFVWCVLWEVGERLYKEFKNKTTALESFGFLSGSEKEITAVFYLERCCCWADAEFCFPQVASAQLCFWRYVTWTQAGHPALQSF